MYAIELIMTALLAMAATIILLEVIYTSRIIAAERRLQLLTERSIACHSSLGWVGCSVICNRATDVAQIENLLRTEYDRYEVIAIIDAEVYGELFSEIVSRYRLLELDRPKHQSETDVKIRRLYRSGQRRYRHLVLLDIAQNVEMYNAMNCALKVASYNYVIPIKGGYYLRQHAIESIAILLSDDSEQNIELLESLGNPSCQIFRYDTVVAKGGFSANLPHKITPRNTIYTYETYICKSCEKPSPKPSIIKVSVQLSLIVAIGLAATLIAREGDIFGIGISSGSKPAINTEAAKYILIICAIATTAITLRGIATYQIVASETAKCAVRSMLCYFRRLAAFFLRRKFIVS